MQLLNDQKIMRHMEDSKGSNSNIVRNKEENSNIAKNKESYSNIVRNKESYCNTDNEVLKNKYFRMLENAKGRDSQTVQAYANAIHEYEIHTHFSNFANFRIDYAISFKDYLRKINS